MVPWTSAEEMIQIARKADTLNIDGLMGADHGFLPKEMKSVYPYTADGKPPIAGAMPYPEVWTTIAAMAAVTTKLKFSTAVYVLPLRNPIEVAKATGTIARISNNRLVLGAGVGWMPEEFEAYGVDFKTRGRRMNECIEVLHTLWDGGFAEYHGEFFDFDPMQVAPAPTERIPIVLGGISTPALRRAAKYAQGWMGNGNTIDEMPRVFEVLREARKEFGREHEPFDIILAMNGMPSKDEMAYYRSEGATGTFLGFPDWEASVEDKLAMMDHFGV